MVSTVEIPDIPLSRERIFREGNFPLVDGWINNLQTIQPMRRTVNEALDTNDNAHLEVLGFPADLLPIMKLWKKNGPDILGTFAHPEEFDLYKTVANFSLKIFEERARTLGIVFPNILVNYYDTVPLHRSVLKPFRIADVGSELGHPADAFNLKSKQHPSLVGTPIFMTGKEIATAGFSPAEVGTQLLRQLKADINELIKAARTDGRVYPRTDVFELIDKGLEFRLDTLLRLIGEVQLHSCPQDSVKISKFIMDLHREITGHTFAQIFSAQPIEDKLGFNCRLLSDNQPFQNLVRASIDSLITTRGIDFLKDVVEPWEALAILNQENNDRFVLTKDENGKFVVMDKYDQGRSIDDNQARKFMAQALPFSKLEALALTAGGVTLHMGSEHGGREKAMDILSIKGPAREHVAKLRIGDDFEQGNRGIVLRGTNVNIPLPLMFAFLGKQGIKDLTASFVGQTNRPIILDFKELKHFFAERLVRDALDPESDIGFANQERTYGIYT